VKKRAAALLPYAVFLVLSLVSWNRWIEPFVDSGRELMVPARVAGGQRLYRDVRFYYGPLAPWMAAGVERIHRRSLPARVALAAAVALGHLEGLRRLAGRLMGRVSGALAAALAVAAAFFLPPGGCHLFPYSLDTSLAVAACTWALVLASGPGLSTARERAAGACVLAAVLARPEYGLALSAALCFERPGPRRVLRLALVPVAVAGAAYAAISIGIPAATLRSEGWLAFLFAPSEFRNVYSSFSGLDRPGLRSAELALALVLLAVAGAFLLAAGFAAARAARRPRASAAIQIAAIAILAAAALAAFRPPAAWRDSMALIPPLVRAAPLLVVAGALARAAERWSKRTLLPFFSTVPDAVLYLGALSAARILLAAGYVGPYAAFFLPLVLVVSTAAVLEAARRADRLLDAPAAAPVSHLAAGALVVFLLFRVADRSRLFRRGDWTRVATPAGAVEIPEPAATATRQALAALGRRLAPGRELVGFPEAGFFQYVLGLGNPLAADQFFPGHLDPAAEAETIRRLRARPPDAVVLANVLTIGHGPAAFGRDYLTSLGQYLDSNFVPIASFGPGASARPRIGDPEFFVEIRVPIERERAPGAPPAGRP
jgi:hypothetical protein